MIIVKLNSSQFYTQFIISLAMGLIFTVTQFINIYVNDGLEMLGFFFFLAGVIMLALLIIVIFELIMKSKKVIQVKIISKYKNSVYALREDGKVKRYGNFSSEELEKITPDQVVELTLGEMTKIPLYLRNISVEKIN